MVHHFSLTLDFLEAISSPYFSVSKMPSSEIDVLKERTSIAARVWSRNTVRLVTHSGLTPEQVNAAIKKLRHVFNEYDNLLVLEYNVVDHE